MRTPLATTLLLAATLLSLGGCEAPAPPPPEDQSVRPARLFQVKAANNVLEHEFVGRVDAAQTIDVAFEVPGLLKVLPIREGAAVRRGELLAALDKRDFELAVREAEVQLKLARQDLERKLAMLPRKAISQAQVDDAQALFDLRKVRVEQASEALADAEIRAPFDAFVTKRYTDSNVVVSAGKPIARLSDLRELQVVASIPEYLLATATTDRVVSLVAEFPFLPGRQFPLQYRENTGEADAVAQTYEVTFTMPRPEQWNILPGMTATVRVRLSAESADLGARIPATALVTGREQSLFVWVVDPETGDISKRPVQIQPAEEGWLLVRTGLQDGEHIVAAGAQQLQPGMRVRPMSGS